MVQKYVFVVVQTTGEVETSLCDSFGEALSALSAWHGEDGRDLPHTCYSIIPIQVPAHIQDPNPCLDTSCLNR